MERLTIKYNGENILLCGYCDGDQCDKEDCAAECPCKCEQDAIDRLAAYEDAEEQGLLVRLPCKVGDTVYRLQYIDDWENPGFFTVGVTETTFSIYLLSEFGKTIFLTREEAECALAKEG